MNKQLLKGFAGMLFVGVAAQATAMEITIYDGEGYLGSGSAGEDQETEPGMVNSQRWDLEAFYLEESDLSMMGGYDFFGGQAEYGSFTSGDLFISIDDAPLYGAGATRPSNGISAVDNSYGYDFVFDVDWETGTYNLYQIDENSLVSTGYYGSNEGSSPFEFLGGAVGDSLATGRLSYTMGLSDAETGFSGGNHNLVSGFDLSAIYASLSEDTTFYSHFTMGCGNDNMMGSWEYVSVPEPATLAMFSIGLAGLWMSRRRHKNS